MSLVLIVAGFGCASDTKAKQAAPATQIEQPYQAVALDPATGVAALAGSWTGKAEVKGYGMAKAVLLLDAKGKGSYWGSMAGAPQNGSFQVSFWDGQWLQVEAMGYHKRVSGRLDGHQLHLQLPYVGSVTLYRASK